MNDIQALLNKLTSYKNLSNYHTELVKRLGLVANSAEFNYNDNVEVPVYDEAKKEWTKISVKISDAVSQLYKFINSSQLGEADFLASDFVYGETSKV